MTNALTAWSASRLENAAPLAALPAGKQAFIRIRSLHKSFGPRHILRGIDLDIYRGETLVIIGGSGSGKTTLMRHLMGFLVPDEGKIMVDDVDICHAGVKALAAWRKRLGVVFQSGALLTSLTVLENVGLPLVEDDHRPTAEIRQRVVEALGKVNLPAEEILALKPASLSGGMCKRVSIARAIIRKVDALLYDEPTTGLDPVTVTVIDDLIRDLQRKMGVTSVVITHDIHAAFAIADRIAFLFYGRIVAVGNEAQIKANPHPALQQMLSGSLIGPLNDIELQTGK